MIRKYHSEDLEAVIDIWYASSSIAHPFLDPTFVEKLKSDMRSIYMPNAESWVYEEDNSIMGFISMLDNEIGGLFVLPDKQSRGIGSSLVDFVSQSHSALEVEVFKKNSIGRAFYEKYGFKLQKQYFHEASSNEVLRLVYTC